MKFLFQICKHLLAMAALGCLTATHAMAGSTEQMQQIMRQLGIEQRSTSSPLSKQEKVQNLMQTNAIPQWRKATDQIRWLRLTPPDSGLSETWKTLDGATNPDTGKAPLTRATTPRNEKELFDMSAWLRWRILSENADGRYSYAYALNLSRMKDTSGNFQREAAAFFFHARLALAVDGARCVDQDSPLSIIAEFESQQQMQSLANEIRHMPPKDRAAALLQAIALEEARGEGPPLNYLCTKGFKIMQKALASGRKAEPSQKTQMGGKIYSVDISEIEPEVLSDELWQKRRREILDNNLQAAIDAL